jgi:hypothetical protein
MDNVASNTIVAIYANGYEHALVQLLLFRLLELQLNLQNKYKLKIKELLLIPFILLEMDFGILCIKNDIQLISISISSNILLF